MIKFITLVAVSFVGIALFIRAGRRTRVPSAATLASDALAVAKLEDEGAPLPRPGQASAATA